MTEITIQEAEDVSFKMALHGIDEKSIRKYQSNCGVKPNTGKKQVVDDKYALFELSNLGMKMGKPSGTIVINRPNEVKK